jgi:hypothetical protein
MNGFSGNLLESAHKQKRLNKQMFIQTFSMMLTVIGLIHD